MRQMTLATAQTGNPWHFGMKARGGVDSQTKVIHAVAAAANVHDATVPSDLL